MPTIIGKTIFIWQTAGLQGRSELNSVADTVCDLLEAAQFQTAVLHSANLNDWLTPDRSATARALKAAGMQVFGSAAVYGLRPEAEGQQAAALVQDLGLDGFLFDAESDFDRRPQADSNAVKLLQSYRTHSAGQLAGWCWWPLYQSSDGKKPYHPKAVLWAALTPGYGDADFGAPMCYWNWGNRAQDACAYLEESWRQWRTISDKPLLPIGRAFIGNNGIPNPAAVQAFDARARSLGACGVAWWSLQHALDAIHLPELWPTLSGLAPFAAPASNTPQSSGPLESGALEALDSVSPQGWAAAIDAWARQNGYTGPQPAAA